MAWVAPVVAAGIALLENEARNRKETQERQRKELEEKYEKHKEEQEKAHADFLDTLNKKQEDADKAINNLREENRKLLKEKEEEIKKESAKHDKAIEEKRKKFNEEYDNAKKIGVQEMKKVESEWKQDRDALNKKHDGELKEMKKHFEIKKEECAKMIREAEEKIDNVQKERQSAIEAHNDDMLKLQKSHFKEIQKMTDEIGKLEIENARANTRRLEEQQREHLEQVQSNSSLLFLNYEASAQRELMEEFEGNIMNPVRNCMEELKNIDNQLEYNGDDRFDKLKVAIWAPAQTVNSSISKFKTDSDRFKLFVRNHEIANENFRKELVKWRQVLEDLMENKKLAKVANGLVPAIEKRDDSEIKAIRKGLNEICDSAKVILNGIEMKLSVSTEFINSLNRREQHGIEK